MTHVADTFSIRFPERTTAYEQDEEFFDFEVDGERRRLRLHDYAEIFDTPGLYEALLYETLKCRSPVELRGLVETGLGSDRGTQPSDLRVLDLGAGNGIMGAELRAAGASAVLGLDLLPEAEKAARRDRPEVYNDYVVTDLTRDDPDARQRIERFRPNCLSTVAALGFGDIPTEAFTRAFDFIPPEGWLAMCIKDRFLEEDDNSGFGTLLRRMVRDGTLDVRERHRYVHRRSVTGEELHYVALFAKKLKNLR